MHTMTLSPPPLPRRRNPALGVAGVVAAHALLFWAAMECGIVERAMAQVAPLTVQIVSAPAPEPEPAPQPVATPRLAPPPLATLPVPEVPVVREVPPEALRLPVAAPAPVAQPTPAPAAAPAAPPAPPAIRQVPPSALRYVVEPPVAVPLASRRLRETGTVVLRVVVDVRGHPRSVTLRQSSGFPRLDEQALGAMRQARFAPCTDAGRPVECESDAPIVYELEN